MNPEELLKTLRDGGLDDASITTLLTDTLNLLQDASKVDLDAEKAEASKLLGVAL